MGEVRTVAGTCWGVEVVTGVGLGCGGGDDLGACAKPAETEKTTTANKMVDRNIRQHLQLRSGTVSEFKGYHQMSPNYRIFELGKGPPNERTVATDQCVATVLSGKALTTRVWLIKLR